MNRQGIAVASRPDDVRSGGNSVQAGYAGDLTPQAAWELLAREARAVLVDVRSRPEWSFVGVPDLSTLGKRLVLVEWQTWPGMAANPEFAARVKTAIPDLDAPVVFLCRSGARSKSAAIQMTNMGYQHCYNLEGGFEGPLDGAKHRGAAAGWKAAGLPWFQE